MADGREIWTIKYEDVTEEPLIYLQDIQKKFPTGDTDTLNCVDCKQMAPRL